MGVYRQKHTKLTQTITKKANDHSEKSQWLEI